MAYLLSMDAGDSKTAWLLTDEKGRILLEQESEGIPRPILSVEQAFERICGGVDLLLQQANLTRSDLLAAAFGVPCCGEYPQEDSWLEQQLQQALPGAAVTVCNDVELGFAGSLCLQDGIHLVAGTGAIAVGHRCGKSARSNGWHHDFSDEGSGYWLGRQTVSLFFKQADRRVPRGPLYEIVRREFNATDDLAVIDRYERQLSGNRKQIAAVQLLLQQAADAGDETAIELYREAAAELALTVGGVYTALQFSAEDRVRVSYSGGVFRAGSHLLEPLRQLIAVLPAELVTPALSPVYGGIPLAMQAIDPERAQELCLLLQQQP